MATGNGKNGADYWLTDYSQLPPYYISLEDARKAGWKSSKPVSTDETIETINEEDNADET